MESNTSTHTANTTLNNFIGIKRPPGAKTIARRNPEESSFDASLEAINRLRHEQLAPLKGYSGS